MRRTIPFLIVVVLLWAAAPASAVKPDIVRHQHIDESGVVVPVCEFGVLGAVSADHTWMDFYDQAGNLVRETLNFTFTGTLTNAGDATKSVPYEGRGFFIWDYQHGREMWHYNYNATIDGQSVKLVAGADAYFYESGEYIFHGLLNWDVACAALA